MPPYLVDMFVSYILCDEREEGVWVCSDDAEAEEGEGGEKGHCRGGETCDQGSVSNM